jgi:hypothetical protein
MLRNQQEKFNKEEDMMCKVSTEGIIEKKKAKDN